MTVYVFESTIDANLKLLVPTALIPEAATKSGKDRWKFAKTLTDFQPEDPRLAMDTAKAMLDITSQGFHIVRLIPTPTAEAASKP
jgi:hypothetical protein